MQENAGGVQAKNSARERGIHTQHDCDGEPGAAVVYHRKANEVVVAGALNSETCEENVWLDAATTRVHNGNAADGSHLCIAPVQPLCDNSKLCNYTVPHTQK